LIWFGLFAQAGEETIVGPLFSDFRLTLDSGQHQQALGPIFYSQQFEEKKQWDFAPLVFFGTDSGVDWTECDLFYPFITYRRFGSEYRLQFYQLLSFSGGKTQAGPKTEMFTIFPLYFQNRSSDTNLNYTALAPFYGNLKNRLFHDEMHFVLFPIYAETRKKDVVTENYLYPFFDVRHGDNLHGWQFWPVFGTEEKGLTFRTNSFHEVEKVGGYERTFAAWPFFMKEHTGLATTNEGRRLVIAPFYQQLRSPRRDETCYGWPFGYWRTEDRENKTREQDLLWPLFVRARGDKMETRVFPLYSHAVRDGLESDWYLWPLYKFNRMESGSLHRDRTRICFFLYSDIRERVDENTNAMRRVDFWPFFTYQRGLDQKESLQAMALLEPFFPNNRSISRDYANLWSFWRAEKNPKTGTASESLLWNLYRRETSPQSKKTSFLFGLYQSKTDSTGTTWRVCYFSFGKKLPKTDAPVAAQ